MDKTLQEAYISRGYVMPYWNKHFKAYVMLKQNAPLERILIYDKEKINDIDGNIKFFEEQSLKHLGD